MKAFHVVQKPLKTEKNKEDRLWFCDYLQDYDSEDFLHLAPSDEFFIYTQRKPNHQNDWVWASAIDAIPPEEKFQEVVKYPKCIGLFVAFTCKRMFWFLKQQGERWSGQYFREKIIPKLHNFLKNKNNVISSSDVILLHDKAPGWTANATQEMLRTSSVDFFSKSEYPGNSPDLNAAEHIGAIIKSRVELLMLKENETNKWCEKVLMKNLNIVLKSMEFEHELFESLLLSYPNRLYEIRKSNGGHTSY